MHEPGSVRVRRELRASRVATSHLSVIEIAAALARRAREGAFTIAERDRAVRTLNADLAACILVELSLELCAEAQDLILRHVLRSGDAVQLASGLYLQRESGQRVVFAAFDDRLNDAARAEGLTVMSFA